jgi:hypothetical protein
MKVTSLNLALRDIQNLHSVVLTNGSQIDIWSPGTRLPAHLTRQIRQQKRAVKARVEQSSIYTCPSPGLHRQYWTYDTGRFYCAMCEQLRPYVA